MGKLVSGLDSPEPETAPTTPTTPTRRRFVRTPALDGGVPSAPSRPSGTDEQEAFWQALVEQNSSVALQARAGTGKSFSCREGIHRIRKHDRGLICSYVAYNRAIANDFQEGLPDGASATTMHSAGYAALRMAYPNLGEPEKFKAWRHMDTILPRRDKLTKQAKAVVVKLAALCKGFLLDDPSPDTLERLAASFAINIPRTLRTVVHRSVPQLLAACLVDLTAVDFDDMVWLPVKLHLDFDPLDFLFIDEAQDLDPCQHAFVKRMAGKYGRLVIVGDPRQAIYGFRGADSQSMDTLADSLPRLTRLPLTLSFRCPVSHVKLVNNLVPDFRHKEDAIEGVIDVDFDINDINVGMMVLCRTNAPLVSLAFRLAGSGVPVAIQGRDLGDGLAKLIESFDTNTANDLCSKVQDWRLSELRRLSDLDNCEDEMVRVNDTCECIMAASEGCCLADEVRDKVKSMFVDKSKAEQSNCVLLSSIHRAKGREARHIVILRPELLPHPMSKSPASRMQESNLAYVAATRSLDRLSFVGPIPDIYQSET
jgi:hypothetical protein